MYLIVIIDLFDADSESGALLAQVDVHDDIDVEQHHSVMLEILSHKLRELTARTRALEVENANLKQELLELKGAEKGDAQEAEK